MVANLRRPEFYQRIGYLLREAGGSSVKLKSIANRPPPSFSPLPPIRPRPAPSLANNILVIRIIMIIIRSRFG